MSSRGGGGHEMREIKKNAWGSSIASYYFTYAAD
jgi:hypothetical protein